MQRKVPAEQAATGREKAGVLCRGFERRLQMLVDVAAFPSFLSFKATLRQSIQAEQMRCHPVHTVYGLLLLLANDFFLFPFFASISLGIYTFFLKHHRRLAQGCHFAYRKKSAPLVVSWPLGRWQVQSVVF